MSIPAPTPNPHNALTPVRGRLSRLVLALAAVSMAVGCTSPRQWVANGFKVGPNYCQPGVEVAEDWIDAEDKRVLKAPAELEGWWGVFNDPVLNELVAEAYRQNLTLREAGARISEARALRAIVVGNFFPQQQDFSASYSHNLSTGSGFDRHFSVWRGSFSLAWEIDFWGRYRRAIEAADADLDATVFDYGDVVVTLVADVAATYVDIRTLQARLTLVRRNVENQRNTYDLAVTRFEGGETSELDVQQAKSSLAQTEAFVPQLETALRQSQNLLCILLGMPPEDIAQRLGEGTIPDVESSIALGIPAATLLQRPDVRRAERLLAAQSARIGVAEADLYPHITLTGTVGRSANQFKDVFNSGAGFGSVGPNLRWDILNYGRLVNNIALQDARFQQLLAAYRQTVLVANSEAENAIIRFLNAQERLKFQLGAAEAADRTNELINLQLDEGLADFNRVFNVQNFKTQQEESAALAKGEVAQSLVAIYRALGGGWPSPFLSTPIAALPPVDEEGDAGEPIDTPTPDDAGPFDEAAPLDEPAPPIELTPPDEPSPLEASLSFPSAF
ncbi:Toluene efflux pump outer membrane protein TtgF precursor [Posidoniimonas corsicana]|uniref:Toluene efflux pump outer membrane protein TtgF n=1 Tax=Posidoniimonas corsicana TaxID=1938618 RepID=A0A5C5VIE2_9BACT|nr:efflux transporter outer membrane subunit [Posidoniimonas corsicana]TWT37777.1 Toluene efflux pump outer membrane protein TtgF precursor [Posidoniimonas corsicana]